MKKSIVSLLILFLLFFNSCRTAGGSAPGAGAGIGVIVAVVIILIIVTIILRLGSKN